MIRRSSWLAAAVPTFGLIAVALGLCSCRGGSGSAGTGPPINDYAALKPDQLTLKSSHLELAGTDYRADVKVERRGSTIEIDLVHENSVIESERYESTEEGFFLSSASAQQYDPPVPLIKYPMHVGDKWTWSGMTDPDSRHAKAEIASSIEGLTINGRTVPNVVRIDVTVSMEGGGDQSPTTSRLSFWIAPGLGVVKRKFGDYSTREPLEDQD